MVAIGTWNLENLFRPGGDGPSDQSKYDAKLDDLADTIKDLEPDLLAVQEVGDPDALEDLMGRVGGEWRTALADPPPDGRPIRVGIVARHPLSDVEQVTDFPERMNPVQVDDDGTTLDRLGRPGLRARVDLGGSDIDVISAHLKSKLLTFPDGFEPADEDERARYAVYALHRRAAEAAGLRAYVTSLLGGNGTTQRVIVAGDMNDEPQAATTQILQGPPGSEICTAGFDRSDKGDPKRLWNLAPRIPKDERYSREYRGRKELIDHLFVSHALLDRIDSVTSGPGSTPSVTDDPTERRDEAGSDHRPVVAQLNI